ncbi:MAG: hypothetical protein PVG79_13015 [Gemmatimonadales bacterium]|jgi:hypothetical protein
MIELKEDTLVFSFPEVHPDAVLRIAFQRTFRIPDDGKNYPLPPGFGNFPLRHIDDFAERIPEGWLERGGVTFPMYQSEALWLLFSDWSLRSEYPFAVKVAAGKINAVTGKPWEDGLTRRPQDYLVAPRQPWLDGFCVKKGVIRQFVAMPLGAGYSAEEQLTGAAEYGGLQIVAYPVKREAYERLPKHLLSRALFAAGEPLPTASAMGLAPGGRMKQKIYDDTFKFEDWDLEHSSRCFVHTVNSLVWRQITGESPPTVPLTAKEYDDAGLPWFDLYDDDVEALEGGDALEGLKSVKELGEEKGDVPLPENESVEAANVKMLRHGLGKDQVREGRF